MISIPWQLLKILIVILIYLNGAFMEFFTKFLLKSDAEFTFPFQVPSLN